MESQADSTLTNKYMQINNICALLSLQANQDKKEGKMHSC